MSVIPRRSIMRRRRREERARRDEDRLRARRREGKRVGARRALEVAEAEAEHDRPPDAPAVRMRRVIRSTMPTRVASIVSGECRPRPSARCEPIEPRRRPDSTRRKSRLCASAFRCRPAARPSIATSVDSDSAASSPTVRTFHACSRRAVAGPTPQTHSTGSGWRNSSSRSGGTASSPSGFATPLATLARNFVRATPTVTGSPTRSRTAARSRTAISTGVPAIRSIPRTSRNASSIDSPSTTGECVLEDGEHRAARLRVRRVARRDDERVGAEAARLASTHRGADAVRLRLVARGQHDTAADDHRPAAKPRIVPLLDRREERVRVRVQHEHMFVTVLELRERRVEAVDLVRRVVVDETDAHRVLRIRQLLAQPERVPVVVRPDAEARVRPAAPRRRRPGRRRR